MSCKIEGCERPARARGWCNMHWLRWRKHGDPMVTRKIGVDYGVKAAPCPVDGCGRPHHAHGYCTMHLRRFQKHGDPRRVEPITGRPLKGANVSWTGVHKRLSRLRGPASDSDCVDCAGRAEEWSYNGKDPNELIERVFGSDLAYSTDLDNYEPRCIPCHRRFDYGDWKSYRGRNEKGQFI